MTDVLAPVFVKVGRRKTKQIRNLGLGLGKVAEKVDQAIDDAIEELDPGLTAGRQIVPVVVVYRSLERDTRASGLPFPIISFVVGRRR